MANNKIVYGNQTLIDLTSDTVTPETLAMGETAHSASGAQIVGTMSPSGPTTILTPSNSSPPAIVDGTAYTADGDGYAIKSFNTKTPSSTPVSVSSGEIDKMGGNGYLINSYANITPSKDGTYFGSGMNKMSSSGYAYDHRIHFNRTVLWTNPSTSTSTSTEFAAQDITLSQSIDNFTFICIRWEHAYGSTTTYGEPIWYVVDLKDFSNSLDKGESNQVGFFGTYYRNSSSTSTYYFFLRNVTYNNATSLHISNCWRMVMNSSGTNTKYNSRIIPMVVYGCKVS